MRCLSNHIQEECTYLFQIFDLVRNEKLLKSLNELSEWFDIRIKYTNVPKISHKENGEIVTFLKSGCSSSSHEALDLMTVSRRNKIFLKNLYQIVVSSLVQTLVNNYVSPRY